MQTACAKTDSLACLKQARSVRRFQRRYAAITPTSSSGHVLKVQIDNDKTFRDDLTGQILDPALVTEARKKELQYSDGRDVWEMKPSSECRHNTCNPPGIVR